MLGVPLATLKSRIRDGLTRLRHGMQDEPAAGPREAAASQLQAALSNRVLIEQASGILAERLQITPAEALVLLRRHARSHGHPLARIARDVIRGTAPGGPPTAPRPPR